MDCFCAVVCNWTVLNSFLHSLLSSALSPCLKSGLKWLPSGVFHEGVKASGPKTAVNTIKIQFTAAPLRPNNSDTSAKHSEHSSVSSLMKSMPKHQIRFLGSHMLCIGEVLWTQLNNIIIDHHSALTANPGAGATDVHHIIRNLQCRDLEALSNLSN